MLKQTLVLCSVTLCLMFERVIMDETHVSVLVKWRGNNKFAVVPANYVSFKPEEKLEVGMETSALWDRKWYAMTVEDFSGE